jgi:chromosome segregation ATPase
MLSEEEEQREYADRNRLRELEAKYRSLETRRRPLIDEMRKLSAEQKALYDRRQAPQEEVEKLYAEHGSLGGKLAETRRGLEAARRHADAALAGLRELRGTFPPADRLRPAQLKKEIAELETHQQTHALKIDEENALIARLRERSKELKQAEARTAVVAEHERQRKEAEGRVTACRGEVDRLVALLQSTRRERDAKMEEIRTRLLDAGRVVADLRAKGKARAAVMDQVDRLSAEMAEVDREAHKIMAESRARRDEARRTMRTYSRAGQRPTEEILASAADAQFEELLRRGKITLGG